MLCITFTVRDDKDCLNCLLIDWISLGFIRSTAPSTPNQKVSKERSGTRNLPKRSTSSVGKSSTSGMGMRSVSVGTLNQAVIITLCNSMNS